MHEERCDHCDLLNTFPLRIEELFQELLEAPGTSNISLEGEVEEWCNNNLMFSNTLLNPHLGQSTLTLNLAASVSFHHKLKGSKGNV